MTARPVVLLELESTVAFLGRRDRDGIPECCELQAGVADQLRSLALDCDLAVLCFGMETPVLRCWIAGKAAAEFFPMERVFGVTGELDAAVGEIGDLLGVATGDRRAVYVGSDPGRRFTAGQRGWIRCPEIKWVRSRLDGERITLFEVEGGRPGSLGGMESMTDRPPDLALPMRIESTDGSSFVVMTAPESTSKSLALSGEGFNELDPDFVDSVVFEMVVGDLSAAERAGFVSEFEKLPFHRSVGNRFFGMVPAGSSAPLPHLARAPHGHAALLIPTVANAEAPQPAPPLDPRALSEDEAEAFRRIPDGEFLEIHESLLRASAPIVGDPRADRRFGSPGNRSALEHVAQFLREKLGERFVYDRINRGFHSGRDVSYNIDARIPGTDGNAGVLILGAHIDSCSGNTVAGAATSAPGADDDASGVAAVLLAARVLADLARDTPPRREIRFVLFNQEENGMVGSQDYVQDLRNTGTRVAAMIQLDMIGWRDPVAPSSFDVRGPGPFRSKSFPNLSVQSELVASAIEEASAVVSPCLHLGRTMTTAPEPPAEPSDPVRSDHLSFYMQGYPACLVSERGLEFAGSVQQDPPVYNPAYHTDLDTQIDHELAAAITRAVTAAVWKMSKN